MGCFLISLDNVRMFGNHGVFEQERTVGNEFEINLKVEYPDELREGEDCLASTLSYAELFEIVKNEMSKPRQLLETVAKEIIGTIKKKYPKAGRAECRITKLRPPISGMTGSASVCYIA